MLTLTGVSAGPAEGAVTATRINATSAKDPVIKPTRFRSSPEVRHRAAQKSKVAAPHKTVTRPKTNPAPPSVLNLTRNRDITQPFVRIKQPQSHPKPRERTNHRPRSTSAPEREAASRARR